MNKPLPYVGVYVYCQHAYNRVSYRHASCNKDVYNINIP